MSSHRPAAAGTAEHADPRRWWTLGVLCLSLMLVMVSNGSLNVALPSISNDLGASDSELQWIVDAYALVFAGLLFAAATIGDRFGRKGALQAGLVLFVLASLAGAFADTSGQLIAVRAVMGVGAAFVMPSTLSILTNVFPAHERGRAIALWAGVSAGGAALGPAISGFLLEHFWWGSVLLLALPIALVALVVGHFLVPTSRDPEGTRIDLPGVALSIVAIVALVYTIIEAPHRGWLSAHTLVGFAVAIVAVGAFVAVERRTARPMLDMALFGDARFSVSSLGITLAFFAMFGTFFLLTQIFQLAHGMSPLGAGLMVLPISLVLMVVAPRAPVLAARFGVRTIVPIGLGIVAFGMVMFGLMAQLGSPYYMWIAGVILPTGMALTMSSLTTMIMASVPRERAGMGSAMNDATRELGGALGVAVLGSVATTVYVRKLPSLDSVSGPAADAVRSGLAGALRAAPELAQPATEAFLDGVLIASIVAAGMAAVAAVVARIFLPSGDRQHVAIPRTTSVESRHEEQPAPSV